TESHFNKHWHTHKDDMNNIDRETLDAVGQTLLEVVYKE
ncbi:MAG: M28 family peptidase, partial [Flavobacteriales bacterium]|nr:M28 family peptidase [Flavobacteriales bacterium]